MRVKKHLVLLLSSCLCLSLPLVGCGKSSSEKTVQHFLEAYQNHNQVQMDLCLTTPGTLGILHTIDGLPQSVTDRYQTIFADFTYAIEREEVSADRANVYVKMTYKDAGTPSIEALHAYQDKIIKQDSDTITNTDIQTLLEQTFTDALSHDLSTIEEILVVPLTKDGSSNWKITPSWEFQNALTANMGLMVNELDYFNNDTALPQD